MAIDLLEYRRGRGCANTARPLTHSLDSTKEGLEVNSTQSKRVCSIEGCGRNHYGRGWCKGHYRRWEAHGDVRADEPLGVPRSISQEERFWWLVDKSDPSDCWPFRGARCGEGLNYGGFGGTTAHRYSWILNTGCKPGPDEVVRHKCDNPICVNPAHLEVGSQQDNVNDMIERGRSHWQRPNCAKGHPRTPENTRISAAGNRTCLVCDKARWANRVSNGSARESQARMKKVRYAERVMRDGRMFAPGVPADRHGSRSAYDMWGCRCAPCTAANSRRGSKSPTYAPNPYGTGDRHVDQ